MNAYAMEPLLPGDGNITLEEKALEFTQAASRLSATLPKPTQATLGELVRTMNCYYSNLIEGHQTLPRDIDAALQDRYSKKPKKRSRQLEAVAHIAVQRLIDTSQDPQASPTSVEYLQWVHRAFCSRLPPEMLKLTNPDTGQTIDVHPGEFRKNAVIVARHVPPNYEDIAPLLAYFERAYARDKVKGLRSVTSIAAAHHRLLWIHPFADGNGRVARLATHALLLRNGLGNPLWSVSRGLARHVEQYKLTLAQADLPRQGALDGRGNLSQKNLVQFCEFFLDTCIEQITFMESLLQPTELARRIKLYAKDEIDAQRLPNGSAQVLITALMQGEIARGEVARITGYKERRARQILSELLQKQLLVATGPKKPVRLGFPLHVVERWLPALYV